MLIQSQLQPVTRSRAPLLEFDFPGLHIGCAEYAEGPTGATVFWFPDRAVGAVDVRGGAPGSYNLDWLRLGYAFPNLDAVTISGGSWYGLGTAAGVAAKLKERGHRSGHWAELANVAGAIIYDYGARRLTSYHPDERLGAAALEAAVPGRFPLGAAGAGRMTMQGSYFGQWLHSGQGGSVRQVEGTRIACFTVVNAVGLVTDRAGQVVAGAQPVAERSIAALLGKVPGEIRSSTGLLGVQNPANTTISLVVTDQPLTYAELQRLAVQVHTSMGRALQPLATQNDGDILFAATTGDGTGRLHPTDLAVVASEVMWDAVLASVPRIEPPPSDESAPLPPERLAGVYAATPDIAFRLTPDGEQLVLTLERGREALGLTQGERLMARRERGNSFHLANSFIQTLRVVAPGEAGARLLLNPGLWQQQAWLDAG